MPHSKSGGTRWWMIGDDGSILRKWASPGESLPPPWVRGHPRRKSDGHIATWGRPKSPQHREKMSRAKLGVPKSAEHREAMRQSHLRRSEAIRDIQRLFPNIGQREAARLLTATKTHPDKLTRPQLELLDRWGIPL